MSIRRIASIETASHVRPVRVANVYRDSDTKEYVVRFFNFGDMPISSADADYYTDDKTDAINTANHYINRG